jgi:hypothetical protein
MNRKLILQVAFGSIAAAALAFALGGCGKKQESRISPDSESGSPGGSASFIFMRGNTPSPSIQFQQPSPNGGLAWVVFDSITGIAPANSFSAIQPSGIRMAFCPANASGNFTTNNVTILPAGGGTLALPANSKAALVGLYQNLPDTNWVAFDSVMITSPNGQPTNLGSPFYISGGPPPGTNYTVAFKSKNGTKTASVVVVVTSTTETPWIPPGHKK